MKISELTAAEAAALLPDAEDLRHDLGRYICFETRFALETDDPEALRLALRADLLQTRSTAGAHEPAWSVWERLCPEALEGDPHLQRIDRELRGLRQLDLDAPGLDLRGTAAAARRVAADCRALFAQLLARSEGHGG